MISKDPSSKEGGSFFVACEATFSKGFSCLMDS